jgi:hypothetical protein
MTARITQTHVRGARTAYPNCHDAHGAVTHLTAREPVADSNPRKQPQMSESREQQDSPAHN